MYVVSLDYDGSADSWREGRNISQVETQNSYKGLGVIT
jgi:hypothetical protein